MSIIIKMESMVELDLIPFPLPGGWLGWRNSNDLVSLVVVVVKKVALLQAALETEGLIG